MAKITLNNLDHRYHSASQSTDDYALKAIDLEFEDGGAYALLGASGCGKTTLLNIISGLITPTRGQILFNDIDVTAMDTSQRNIAQVFQFGVVYDTMSVWHNLAFPLKNRKYEKSYIDKRVRTIADMIGLGDALQQRAGGLTAAQKQKVSLARGMVREDVNAILFDEPLTIIDPHLKWVLRTQIKSLHKRLNHTMIYVTHDQTEALTFADKVVVMHQGEVVQIGTPQALFAQPEHTFVGYFIGSPGMNFLPIRLNSQYALLSEFKIPLAARYEPSDQKDLNLGIRPEFIHLATPDADNAIPITVKRIEDIGRHKIIRAVLAHHDINIIVDEDTPMRDTPTHITLAPQSIHIYDRQWRLGPLT